MEEETEVVEEETELVVGNYGKQFLYVCVKKSL